MEDEILVFSSYLDDFDYFKELKDLYNFSSIYNFCPEFTNSFLAKEYYTTEKSWYCVINNRTRFVVFIKRKCMRRRLHYYTNCQSTLNPTVLSAYLIMCGDIHPNPGPTSTNTSINGNSSCSNNCVSRERQPGDKQSNLFCMHMNARSLKKNINTQGNLFISNLIKFQEMVYSESVDIMFVTEIKPG